MRVRGYAAGTPCWSEVASSDPPASQAFYHALFGWTFHDGRFTLGGRAVAGLRQLAAGHPPAWLTYVAVDDIAGTAATVRRAGGTVRLPPRPVGDAGSAAVFGDPAGAVFAGWQRGSFFGAQVRLEPGAPCWSELSTVDVAGATAFYGTTFGWGLANAPSLPEEPYYEWRNHSDAVAGLLPMDHRFPDGVPPHWTSCFLVGDAVSACDLVSELGGTVARKPTSMVVSAGFYARVADPQGAHFALVELADFTS